MEIINELESDRRGPYGGALGYISFGGAEMDVAITIRSVILEKNQAKIVAGAGIVHDSIPENEYIETLQKSDGMMKALGLAERIHAARNVE